MSDRSVLVTALQGEGWQPAVWREADPAVRQLSSLAPWRGILVE
ncbi:hypothetical protein [Curtobacterium sp. ME12]|nr:hypothetical protein [Curtobacterium sp. ME12]